MTNKLIRIATVMDMTGKSRSSIYADIAEGSFPQSILIGARSVAWAESDIAAWIKAKIDAVKPKSKKEKERNELYEQATKEAAPQKVSKPYELRLEDI